MELVRFQCPSCGAELPPRAPTDEVACEYCGSRFAPERARSAKTSAGAALDPAALQQLRQAHAALAQAQRELKDARAAQREAKREAKAARREARAKRRAGRGLLTRLAGLLGSLLTLLFIAAMVVGSLAVAGIFELPWLRELGIGERIEAALDPEGVDPWAGPPMLVEIGGAPALIVRMREHAGQQLYVDAYTLPDGPQDALTRRWRIGPLGSGKGLEHARFTVAGPWVVVSSSGRELFVHELGGGARVRTLTLRDEVEYLCTVDPGTVYVRLGKRHELLSVEAGSLARAKGEPPGCEPWRGAELDPSTLDADAVTLTDELADAKLLRAHLEPGSSRGLAWIEGPLAKAEPAAEPAEQLRPRMIGFEDPGTRKRGKLQLGAATWSTAPAAKELLTSTLADGRLVSAWIDGEGEVQVGAHGLADGSPLWTRSAALAVGDRLVSLRAGLGYVLVVRSNALDVLDGETGTPLVSLGSPPNP